MIKDIIKFEVLYRLKKPSTYINIAAKAIWQTLPSAAIAILTKNPMLATMSFFPNMTQEAYDKFLQLPFELIYRNATLDNQMKEVHWTEIYEVNWTYIEKLSLE